ncbi:MAG: branched-chain amino acid ABC transporter permease [Desulfohalobiaceae bacterium]|nr:branched-chain amino acid ABC transporter permease [Desulfohalobiaceae bacterium]
MQPKKKANLFSGGNVFLGLFLLFLIFLPQFFGYYYVYLTISIFILALSACSLNLLLGFTGILSFGHAGFYAIGAYTSALILKDVYPSILIAFPIAMFICAVVGFLFGLICIKVAEKAAVIFFAMLTLAFGQIIYTIAFKWTSLTGGDNGMTGIPSPKLHLGFYTLDLFDPIHFYYLALILVGVSIWILYRIVNSPLGITLRAIRDNPERSRFMGQNVRIFHLTSFVISATFTGLAGAILAPFECFVSPELSHWSKSAEIVLVSILGGVNTFIGPLIGAFVMKILEDIISSYTQYWAFILGIILIIILLFMPEGIVGRIKKMSFLRSLRS